MYLSLFRLSAQKEILLIKNNSSIQIVLLPRIHTAPWGKCRGVVQRREICVESSLFCTSRKPNIPRVGQLEQREGNVGKLEEAEHKAVRGGPWRGTILELPCAWDAEGKPGPTVGPLPD